MVSFRIDVLVIALLFPGFLAVDLQGQWPWNERGRRRGVAVLTANAKVNSQGKQEPCPNALTQREIDRCATEDFKKAEKELNGTYKRIVRNLSASNRKNLVEAQRSWLKYRVSNCYAQRQFTSGSLAPAVEAFCLRDTTDARTKELIRIYEPIEEE